jgi:hypothetical protein
MESPTALAARLCAKHALPDWIELALVKELEERLETGSDDRKIKEAARIESELAACTFVKGPLIANGAFGEVFKGFFICFSSIASRYCSTGC